MIRTSGLAALLLAAAPSFAAQRALNVAIFGMGPPVDGAAYKRVLQITGKMVAENKLQKYLVKGFGIEGGSSFCIELSYFQHDSVLDEIESLYRQVQPNPQTTSYDIRRVASCD